MAVLDPVKLVIDNYPEGQVESFDQFVVLLKNPVSQMVYKHAISTIVPARAVNITTGDEKEEENQSAE